MTPSWCHDGVVNLEGYVVDLRRQLGSAAGGADEATRQLAERLTVSLDAAARLVLLEALSEAAAEITRELAPGSVEVRLRGREPEFVVSNPVESIFAERDDLPAARTPPEEAELRDEASTSRTTLRLPDQLKARVEKAAADDGLSLNTWLVRAISAAVEPKSRRAAQRGARGGDSFTGWVR